MRRTSTLVMSFIILALILPAGIAAGQEKVTLVIWGESGTEGCINDPTRTEDACIYARLMNDKFEEANPDIDLKWEYHGWDAELRQNLITAALGGVAPDITVGETFMRSFLNLGAFAPLTLPEEVRANIIPGTVLAVTVDDQIYGVAQFTNVFALEVNADVVRKAGLDPDTLDLSTWDKVTEAAAAINAAGNGEYYGFSMLGQTAFPAAAAFRFAPYLFQAGSDFCNMPACDTPTFNDPKAVPVYEWFRELYPYTPPGLAFNPDEGYVFGQLFAGVDAMQTAGGWHPKWAKDSGCQDCRYLPLPLPEGGQRANVVVGNAIYSIMQVSQHKEEAARFLEWMVSDEVQIANFWATGRSPSTFSALEAVAAVAEGDTSSVPAFYYEQMGKTEEDAIAAAKPVVPYIDELVNGDVRILPPFATEADALLAVWNDMFAQVLTTDRPIQEILDEFQAQAETIIAE